MGLECGNIIQAQLWDQKGTVAAQLAKLKFSLQPERSYKDKSLMYERCLVAAWLKATLKSLCMFLSTKYILKEEIQKLKLEMTAAKNGILNMVGLFSSVTCNW